MKNQILILIITLSAITPVIAQIDSEPLKDSTKKFGKESFQIGISDAALFEQLMFTVPGVGSNSRELLMAQNVKPFMMPVRKLGTRGNSLSYAAAICLEFYTNLERNYKVNLSPDYISLSLERTGRKLIAKEVFQFLTTTGTVSAAILPYDASEITTGVYATQKYQIKNYLNLFSPITRGKQRVFETKKALMRGNPVLVEFKTPPQTEALSGIRVWEPKKLGTESNALIVVGYDETEEAFELMGTWGKDWGTDGYVWISYEDFSKFAQDGFVMIPGLAHQ